MTLKNKAIAFIGAGNMAEALIRGLLAGKTVAPKQIIATDIRADRLELLAGQFGIRIGPAGEADIIVLAVKPQQMSDALAQVAGKHLLISIAAGIATSRIEKEIGGKPRVVRVMPNTPALVGAGAAALCKGRYASDDDLTTAEAILSAVGTTVRVEEKLMDAVTALSGSGPAYIFYVTEAMIKAGVRAGLNEELAKKLATQTVFGAAKLLAESDESPAALRQKVTSPGGTTEAALKVMSDRKLAGIFVEAVAAAAQRSRELSGEGGKSG
jgi:pyrroline-5-carboxylate reductase